VYVPLLGVRLADLRNSVRVRIGTTIRFRNRSGPFSGSPGSAAEIELRFQTYNPGAAIGADSRSKELSFSAEGRQRSRLCIASCYWHS
jgi:hypothetical protein